MDLKKAWVVCHPKTANTVIYYYGVVVINSRCLVLKAAIIGLDGVPHDLLLALANNDTMSHTKELLKQGNIKQVKSSLPPNSAVSWSSIMTARNPGEHAIYGFTEFIPGTYTVSYHHSIKLKAQPFWQRNNDKRTLVINLPATYPPQALNGLHVSGFVSPQLEKAVYPGSLSGELVESGYMVDVNAPTREKEIERFLGDLSTALDRRTEFGVKQMQGKWDICFFVVTGTDRIGHYLWNAYWNKKNQYHEQFQDYFRQIDDSIYRLTQQMPEDTVIMMLSDHGMNAAGTAYNLNTLLKEEGYLRIDDDPDLNYNAVKKGTKAFLAETNKIYLNTEKRFPLGSVNQSDRIDLLDEIIYLLKSVRHGGRQVVKAVYSREELYEGPYLGDAPDLIVLPERDFSFKTYLFSNELVSVDGLQGKHTEDNAFLYLNNESDEFSEARSVEDALLILRSIYKELKI
jgi:predicted AlkP superfamily phosphohydrolase/phosphomutase